MRNDVLQFAEQMSNMMDKKEIERRLERNDTYDKPIRRQPILFRDSFEALEKQTEKLFDIVPLDYTETDAEGFRRLGEEEIKKTLLHIANYAMIIHTLIAKG